jgi:hypothetical protein
MKLTEEEWLAANNKTQEANPAKQKARELLHKFYLSLPNNGGFTGINNIHDRWDEGKKCAIMTTNEIINTLNMDIRDLDVRGSVLLDLIQHWREVKQEIEKL